MAARRVDQPANAVDFEGRIGRVRCEQVVRDDGVTLHSAEV
jgi:hypothetical protein